VPRARVSPSAAAIRFATPTMTTRVPCATTIRLHLLGARAEREPHAESPRVRWATDVREMP
jgi:hypothetical protein